MAGAEEDCVGTFFESAERMCDVLRKALFCTYVKTAFRRRHVNPGLHRYASHKGE